MKKIAIVILIGLTIISCNNSKKIENTNLIKDAFLDKVKTTEAIFVNREQELVLTGKVEYDPDKVISYVPLISGVVEKTYFSLGDRVQKGQSLLDIRSAELSTLQSEKIALEADEKIAERELKTAQSMFDDKMISEKEWLEAKGNLKQIHASLEKIKADMGMYGADKGNGIFTVNAPMTGFIVQKKASSGSTVSPDGDPVFTIADLSTVWVMANVYAGNLLFVKEGMDVEMTTLSYPDEVFKGKINTLSQVFDPEEKVLKARIVMDNKNLKLKPEMSILVTLKDKKDTQSIAIPSDALIFDDNQYFVVVEETKGYFVVRNVAIQGTHNKTAYILSGVLGGENVVVKNQLLIYQGFKEE
jgi:cobalt-zinc-cadmium efflux system membrane fusion protein